MKLKRFFQAILPLFSVNMEGLNLQAMVVGIKTERFMDIPICLAKKEIGQEPGILKTINIAALSRLMENLNLNALECNKLIVIPYSL